MEIVEGCICFKALKENIICSANSLLVSEDLYSDKVAAGRFKGWPHRLWIVQTVASRLLGLCELLVLPPVTPSTGQEG